MNSSRAYAIHLRNCTTSNVLDEIKTVHDWRYFIGGYRTAEAQRHIMMVVAFDSPNCKYKNIAKRRKSQISSTITCGNNFESMHTIGIFVIVWLCLLLIHITSRESLRKDFGLLFADNISVRNLHTSLELKNLHDVCGIIYMHDYLSAIDYWGNWRFCSFKGNGTFLHIVIAM